MAIQSAYIMVIEMLEITHLLLYETIIYEDQTRAVTGRHRGKKRKFSTRGNRYKGDVQEVLR